MLVRTYCDCCRVTVAPAPAATGVLQFLNSALSTIIANAHLPVLEHAFDGTVAGGLFFQGIYTDLTPNWYKVVGRSLVISQFVAAVLRATNLPIRYGTTAVQSTHTI
jgi:hypothetical protein